MSENDNFALVPRPPSALEKAVPGAKRILSVMVEDTLAVVRRDKDAAEAIFQRGLEFLKQNEHERAFDCFKRAAGKGHAGAQVQLGLAYRFGGTRPWDEVEAVKWYRKAAEQGNARAQFYLGCAYEHGQGVPQNYSEAFKWLRKAAEQGNAAAQLNLGVSFRDGQGVPQDYIEAVMWLRKAAEQGWGHAQFVLGKTYHHGQGVPQDYVEAYKWFRLAAEAGNKKAGEKIISIRALLSPQEFQEAERRYSEFKAGHQK